MLNMFEQSRRRGRRRRRHQPASFRADIQGLRAVAVGAVIVNHLTGHPVGGFVGVDVFFVISGYLITGLLIRDSGPSADGHLVGAGQFISNFYRRRIRRIIPAALVVTVATLAVAYVVFDSARFERTWIDALWATGFGANWHFLHIGTNYFTASDLPSPLQHYWSLSVEEQFYFGWPLLLFAFAALAGRSRPLRSRRVTIGTLSAVLCAVSLGFAFGQSRTAPTSAYFSTFTRSWELGLGALLACFVPLLPPMPAETVSRMSWAGTGVIAVSLFTSHGGTGFPAPGALPACIGAALVIAAMSGTTRATNPVLTHPLMVWIGDMSYSVYLVHFPVIILLSENSATPTTGHATVTALLLIVGLSPALHLLVERPILDSRFLLPASAHEPAGRINPITRDHLAFFSAVCVVLALGVFVASPDDDSSAGLQTAGGFTSSTTTLPLRPAGASVSSTSMSTTTTISPYGPLQAALSKEIDAAVAAPGYPDLHPSMQSVISGRVSLAEFERCAVTHSAPDGQCVWGSSNAAHLMYVIGDSTSTVYAQSLAQIVKSSTDWKMRYQGAGGCRFSSVTFEHNNGSLNSSCPKHNEAVVAEIQRLHPDMVVVTNDEGNELADGSKLSISGVMDAFKAELAKFQASTTNLVFLEQAPRGNLPGCFHGSDPSECLNDASSTAWLTYGRALAALAKGMGATFVDSSAWFCDAQLHCPAFVGTTPTMHDHVHASTPYAIRIAPVIAEAMRKAGLPI